MENDTPLHIDWNTVHGSDGSATCKMGLQNEITVIASVMGPGPVKSKQESFEEMSLEVDLALLNAPSSIMTNVLSFQIKEMISHFIIKEINPRSICKISLQVVTAFLDESQEGSIRVVAFNAAMCALIMAGIPLKGIGIASISSFNFLASIETIYEYKEEHISGLLVHQNIKCPPTSIDVLQSYLIECQLQSSLYYQMILKSLREEYK